MTGPSQAPPPQGPVDLARLTESDRWAVSLKSETAVEREARLDNDKQDAIARRRREAVLFHYGLGIMTVMLVAAVAAAFLGAGALQTWGMSLAMSVVSAAGGFVVGKNTKDK